MSTHVSRLGDKLDAGRGRTEVVSGSLIMHGRVIHLDCSAAAVIVAIDVVVALTCADASSGEAAEELDHVKGRPSLIMMPERELAASRYVHKPLPAGALCDCDSDA